MRTLTVTIALLAIVCAAQADILIDFGVPDPNVDPMADPNQWLPSGPGWNTAWTIVGTTQVFNNLVDTTNTPTAVSLSVSGTASGWGYDGPGGVDANNLYPWEAQIDYVGVNDQGQGTLVLSGLTEPSYLIRLFGSRNSTTTTRSGSYTVNGVTQVMDCAMNTTQKLSFPNVVPASGVITITMTGSIKPPDTYAYGYLNVMEIIPEPATLSLLAVGGLLAIRRRRR